MCIRIAAKKLTEEDAQLELGEPRAEAIVLADAEPQVPGLLAARDVETEGIASQRITTFFPGEHDTMERLPAKSGSRD